MVLKVLEMKKIFAALLAVLFITGAVLGCSKTPQTELNQAKQQAAEQVSKTAKSGLEQLQEKQARTKVEEGRAYTGKAEVALYIHTFHKLPGNFITKREAERLGWKHKGTLNEVAPGKSIGGDRYGNYEGLLPQKSGRSWKECDIDYKTGNRNAKRLVYSKDGLIYYTDDHYKSFEKLY